ncbi:MAG: hypothetical protein ACKVS7_07400 [Gemmatimonadaceae bacterium]
MPKPRLLLLAATVLVTASCYQDPNVQLDQMQEQLDIANTMTELANRTSELQLTLDSLRQVVAKQDTVIYKLANLAGVPYTR